MKRLSSDDWLVVVMVAIGVVLLVITIVSCIEAA